jgi:hypothetical protein
MIDRLQRSSAWAAILRAPREQHAEIERKLVLAKFSNWPVQKPKIPELAN